MPELTVRQHLQLAIACFPAETQGWEQPIVNHIAAALDKADAIGRLMGRAPTVYAGLLEKHVEVELLESLRDFTRDELGEAGARWLPMLEENLRKAYVAGIVDGFAQGVAYESNRLLLIGEAA